MPAHYSPLERRLALDKLDAWIGSSRHRDFRDQAVDDFFAAIEGPVSEEDLAHGLEHQNLQSLVNGWLRCDSAFGSAPCAALSLLASSKGARLPLGSRRFLEILGLSVLGVYEVLEVDRGSSCRLRSFLGKDEYVVRECLGTQTMTEEHIIGARVIPGGDGGLVFEDLVVLPGDLAEAEKRLGEILALVAEAGAQLSPELGIYPDLDELDEAYAINKTLAPLLAHWWFDGNFEDQQEELVPALVNGEVYEPGRAEYLLLRDAPPLAALASIPGMEEGEPGVWDFIEETASGRRLLGSAAVSGPRIFRPTLILHSSGRQSMAKLRKAVKGVFGDSWTHLCTRYEKPRMLSAEGSHSFATQEVKVDFDELGIDPDAPDAMQRVEHALRQQFLDRWPDEEVPALDGLQPREAALIPGKRDQVIRLLDQFQADDQARVQRTGAAPLDFETVLRTLGLPSPKATK